MSEGNAQQLSITVNDLQSLAAIVKLAVKRGAFEAEEMTAVGSTYDKLNGYLKAFAEQSAKQAANQSSQQKAETPNQIAQEQ